MYTTLLWTSLHNMYNEVSKFIALLVDISLLCSCTSWVIFHDFVVMSADFFQN